jgi:molybdopterin-containing oxidoreductase family iron-sulfur binding subunit
MSKHYQFESIMSITGSNADGRAQIKPSESANVLAYILKSIGGSTFVSSALSGESKKVADAAIAALKSSRNESLVVCGSNNEAEQLLTNAINNQLKAYGTTIDLSNDVKLYQSNDKEASQLFDAIISGKGPAVLINLGANPVYTAPNGEKLRKGLDRLTMYVSTARYADESASVASYIIPDHHQLEAWNDFRLCSSSAYNTYLG